MGAGELLATERLKREDCKRTKHDSIFSNWKILVGPSDWEDYCSGKEGATRYRIHNLPTSSVPGVYELGITVLPVPGLGRDVDKLDSSRIVAVYIGQAGNVRTRLQGYGRSGNHLGKSNVNKGSSLFEEIFLRGYSIVFRWASTGNKCDAEKTEACLLERFDYAWNKGQNGASRPNEILQKLDKIDSTSFSFFNIARKLKIFSQKPVGVKIEAHKPPLLHNENTRTTSESKKLLTQVFNFSKSRPRLVSVKSSPSVDLQQDIDNMLPICEVTLDDGTLCMKQPVPSRVRCEVHKGRKKSSSSQVAVRNLQDEYSICGLNLGNGKLCENQAVAGRKRCKEHKGLRQSSRALNCNAY